jgi:hypothetical protein
VSAGELVVVCAGGAAGALPASVPFAVRRVVELCDLATPAELAAAAEVDRAHVLWLPPWTMLDTTAADEVAAWLSRAGGPPRVARARIELAHARSSAAVGRRVGLSDPGAVTLAGERALPWPEARVDELASAWRVMPPATLREHLESVNAQSSVVARLRHAAAEPASWRSLTWRPAAFAVRALASTRGGRRGLLPHVVIEAYREVLVAAKLWELAHVAGRT